MKITFQILKPKHFRFIDYAGFLMRTTEKTSVDLVVRKHQC